MNAHRASPQALEAEQALLGAVLLDPSLLLEVSDQVRPTDFYRPDHAGLYRLFLDLQAAGEAIDPIVVGDRVLRADGKLGDYGYVLDLPSKVPARVAATRYAQMVRRAAQLRRLCKVAAALQEEALAQDAEPAELVARTRSALDRLSQDDADRDWTPLSTVIEASVARIDERSRSTGEVSGTPTGFDDLDHMTMGLQPSQLWVLAARPGEGKSALGLNIAWAVAQYSHRPVALFSLEMDRVEIGDRLISSSVSIPGQDIRTGRLTDEQWRRVETARELAASAPIYIDDRPRVTIEDLRTRARRLAARVPDLGLVLVDYLQLVEGMDPRANRVQQVSEISRGLKVLAKELRVPVLALSQLSRDIEKRKGEEGRPKLSDLRDSGAIEQDADVILFLHRSQVSLGGRGDQVDLIVAKQRAGRTGDVALAFSRAMFRFDSILGGSV